MSEPEADEPEPRYTIRRRNGQTWCENCDVEDDNTTYILWLTAAAARQRGFTQCAHCGRELFNTEGPREA